MTKIKHNSERLVTVPGKGVKLIGVSRLIFLVVQNARSQKWLKIGLMDRDRH
ncbi:hypothetical protein [Nostoc sp. ChiQUE01b]|uniref:hypothetical protein n=1 Tax=Nostoc sp. ChiQUE01b TaxID=3075376 RepID=UPI002AD2A239|nr:hypothetical protein [Nostoc sp. ChiQUE01b]MDZ8259195.1 hypothetical protein [Nostoc sp. ChiQUE01b]